MSIYFRKLTKKYTRESLFPICKGVLSENLTGIIQNKKEFYIEEDNIEWRKKIIELSKTESFTENQKYLLSQINKLLISEKKSLVEEVAEYFEGSVIYD